MPETSIKWPIAIDPDGDYVRIENAESGGLYVCPQCSARFVARQGAVKSWHFAHYSGAVCTGESARHDITKHMIAAALGTINELPLYCDCLGLPTKPFAVELTDAQTEQWVGEYRVDVTCRMNGNPLCIEVIDSNRVQEDKIRALGNRLVEVDISQLTNAEVQRFDGIRSLLERRLSRALKTCLGTPMFIHTFPHECRNCGRLWKVRTVCKKPYPDDSLPHEVLKELKGDYPAIKFRHRRGVRGGHWANICPECLAEQDGRDLWIDMPKTADRETIETILVCVD